MLVLFVMPFCDFPINGINNRFLLVSTAKGNDEIGNKRPRTTIIISQPTSYIYETNSAEKARRNWKQQITFVGEFRLRPTADNERGKKSKRADRPIHPAREKLRKTPRTS